MNGGRPLALLLALLAPLACQPGEERAADPDPDPDPVAVDEAGPEIRASDREVELADAQGNVLGTATLADRGDQGVVVRLEARGLPPGRSIGFHFHEHPRCEGPAFESAGGHFNPDAREHGFDNPEGFHVGDMPNLEVADDGTFQGERLAERARMDQSGMSVLEGPDGRGTALIIHAEEDDYRTDPAGGAGDRIACGVVRRG